MTETQALAAAVMSIVYVAQAVRGTSIVTFSDGRTIRHTTKFLRQRFDEQGIYCLNVHQPPFRTVP